MDFYTTSQREAQDRFGSRPLAEIMHRAVVRNSLDAEQAAFVATRDFFLLATVDSSGSPTVSWKGGDVGTVQVLDPGTLAFPVYDGNGMFLSVGNIDATATVGLLFVDLETPHRLRVQGTASVDADDPLRPHWPGALAVVRVRIETTFVNCARYVHRYVRADRSPYLPATDGSQAVPMWKRVDAFQPFLAPADRDAVVAAGGTVTPEEYHRALAEGRS